MTMHHMSPEEFNLFHDFEKSFHQSRLQATIPRKPLVFKDVYYHFVSKKMTTKREDWDNLSTLKYQTQPGTRNSRKQCRTSCRQIGNCFQYKYQNATCFHGRSFKLGMPTRHGDTDHGRSYSGWDLSKINAWVNEQGECREVKWPRP
jgi:hypothetical protein